MILFILRIFFHEIFRYLEQFINMLSGYTKIINFRTLFYFAPYKTLDGAL